MKSINDAAYQRFLRSLRDARTEAGISQQELARRLERHQTYVSKVENGERTLDLLEFLRWTRELGRDPLDLLSGLAQEVQQRKRRIKMIE